MAKMHDSLSGRVPAIALVAVLSVTSGVGWAQNLPDSSRQPDVENDSRQPIGQTPALVCTGKVVRSGNKLVLSTPDATYQLEDQSQVQPFVNQVVKVTGVLDAVSGTIRVDAIGPA